MLLKALMSIWQQLAKYSCNIACYWHTSLESVGSIFFRSWSWYFSVFLRWQQNTLFKKIITRKSLINSLAFLEICKLKLKVPPSTPLLFLDESVWVLSECTELILMQKTQEDYTTHPGGKLGVHFTAEGVS